MTTESQEPCQIAAFYRFGAVSREVLAPLSREFENLAEKSGLRGLIIFATEGINGTVAGASREVVECFLIEVARQLAFSTFEIKWSEAREWPYREFKVRLRQEIVTLGKPEIQPVQPQSPTHLSPDEWDRYLEGDNVIVLDTRNSYETRIGKFKGAIDPGLEEFHEFSAYVERSNLPKEKKILIYCTGGIRCEKALVEMNRQGYENVFQLDGGILGYLAQRPRRNFEGECFVFDNRVAVDQDLKPTLNFKMCPHCGQPADQQITCVRCDCSAVICEPCSRDALALTCSKNCAHHHRLAPGRKGRAQRQGRRYQADRSPEDHL